MDINLSLTLALGRLSDEELLLRWKESHEPRTDGLQQFAAMILIPLLADEARKREIDLPTGWQSAVHIPVVRLIKTENLAKELYANFRKRGQIAGAEDQAPDPGKP